MNQRALPSAVLSIHQYVRSYDWTLSNNLNVFPALNFQPRVRIHWDRKKLVRFWMSSGPFSTNNLPATAMEIVHINRAMQYNDKFMEPISDDILCKLSKMVSKKFIFLCVAQLARRFSLAAALVTTLSFQ